MKIIWSKTVPKSVAPQWVPVEEREFVIGCLEYGCGSSQGLCRQCEDDRDDLLELFESGKIVERESDA